MNIIKRHRVLAMAGALTIIDSAGQCFLKGGYLWALDLNSGEKAWLALAVFIQHTLFVIAFDILLKFRKLWIDLFAWAGLTLALLSYAASWATALKIGAFWDIEAVRFMFHNPAQIIEHLEQSSRHSLLILGMMIGLSPAAAAVMMMYLRGHHVSPGGLPKWKNQIVIIISMMIWLWAGAKIKSDQLFWYVQFKLTPAASLLSDFGKSPESLPNGHDQRDVLSIQWHQITEWPLQGIPSGSAREEGTPVILIVVESLRNDVFNDKNIMPHVVELLEDSLYFPQAVSPSTESDYSWPSILSSQYPLRENRHHYYPWDIRYPRVLIYDALKMHGYRTGLFSAQNERWSKMRNFLESESLDTFFDSSSVSRTRQYVHHQDKTFSQWVKDTDNHGKIDDAVVLENGLKWVENIHSSRFLLIFNFQRPHYPYSWPMHYTPAFSPHALDFETTFAVYPESRISVMKNRYFNALHYTDQQIGRVVHYLKESQMYDKSLIIVTGDHGESFYEKGFACHGTDLYNEALLTPIVIKTPQAVLKGVRTDIVQSIDIVPTICQLVGLNCPPAFQGNSLLSSTPEDRPAFASVQTALAKQDAIILGEWKFINDYKNNKEMLFNLRQDPAESVNLIHRKNKVAGIMRDQLKLWRSTQLNYYQDSGQHEKYYPPRFLNGTLPEQKTNE